MRTEVAPGYTPLGVLALVAVFAAGWLWFLLMRVVARRARRAADRRMAGTERRRRGFLCRDLARQARSEMRARAVRRLISGRLDDRGGSRDDDPGPAANQGNGI